MKCYGDIMLFTILPYDIYIFQYIWTLHIIENSKVLICNSLFFRSFTKLRKCPIKG